VPSETRISPRLLKGALAVYPSQTPGTQPKIIVFQYNPDNLKRTLAIRAQPPDKGNAGGAREEVLRVLGPPVETVTMTLELDAVDQLEHPDSNRTAVEHGLHPAIATLELLLYPSTSTTQAQQQQAQQGQVQVTPADLPLTLMVWSSARVVPVLITSFAVTEEAFDVNLNPIRAKVDIGFKVLTHMELKADSLGYQAYLSYQRQKETLSQQNQPQGDDTRIRGMLPA
jgi:hypothetical protein